MAHMQGQDWNTVVLRAKQQTTAQKTSKSAVQAAMRSGTFLSDVYYVHYVFQGIFNANTAQQSDVILRKPRKLGPRSFSFGARR
jgi:hypothetical protein